MTLRFFDQITVVSTHLKNYPNIVELQRERIKLQETARSMMPNAGLDKSKFWQLIRKCTNCTAVITGCARRNEMEGAIVEQRNVLRKELMFLMQMILT